MMLSTRVPSGSEFPRRPFPGLPQFPAGVPFPPDNGSIVEGEVSMFKCFAFAILVIAATILTGGAFA